MAFFRVGVWVYCILGYWAVRVCFLSFEAV